MVDQYLDVLVLEHFGVHFGESFEKQFPLLELFRVGTLRAVGRDLRGRFVALSPRRQKHDRGKQVVSAECGDELMRRDISGPAVHFSDYRTGGSCFRIAAGVWSDAPAVRIV